VFESLKDIEMPAVQMLYEFAKESLNGEFSVSVQLLELLIEAQIKTKGFKELVTQMKCDNEDNDDEGNDNEDNE